MKQIIKLKTMKQIKIKINQELYDRIQEECLEYENTESSKIKMLIFTGIIYESVLYDNNCVDDYITFPLSNLYTIFKNDQDGFDTCLRTTIRLFKFDSFQWRTLAFSINPQLYNSNYFELRFYVNNDLAIMLSKFRKEHEFDVFADIKNLTF
ncbi:MAG: hypothetical protein ACOYO1_07315 [Bacteroidales bacterium]